MRVEHHPSGRYAWQENSMQYTIAVILLIALEFQLILMSKSLSTRPRSAIGEAIRIRFTGES